MIYFIISNLKKKIETKGNEPHKNEMKKNIFNDKEK